MASPSRPRLAFYRRLSAAEKREYDRSDALRSLPLDPDPALGSTADHVVAALASGSPAAVGRAAQALVDGLCAALGRKNGSRLPVPRVKVLRTRPRRARSELHGLYTELEGGRSEVRLWMLTAAQRQRVKPRTFLRTLLHEICHHLDATVLDLPHSLHTPGFHARESSLLRSLEQSGARIPGKWGHSSFSQRAHDPSTVRSEEREEGAQFRQLELF